MAKFEKLRKNKLLKRTHDPIWQLQIGVLVVMALQLFTDDSFLPYNKFIIVGFEAALMVILSIVTSDGYSAVSRLRRSITTVLIACVAAINVFSLAFLVIALLFDGDYTGSGQALLSNGLAIYVTNIFMFALLYWELDGGGPDRRVKSSRKSDFLFPQMIYKAADTPDWLPGFTDYLYLSTTNVTNFASADTVPISHRAKLLMMIQAIVAVVTVVLVAARAVGVLT